MVYDSTVKALSEWRKRMGIAANNCGKHMKRIIIGRLFLTPIRRSLACMTFTLSVAVVTMSGCRRPVPTIAVIPRTCGTWLWEAEHTGVERAAPAYGLSVYWNAPMRDDDVQGQIEILTHALDHGAKGIIVSPVEALPLRTPVYRALATGTPVVVVGTDLGLAPGKKLAYVVNDERSGGQMAARRLGSILHGHGSIAILGINKQLTSTAERARNLEITLAEEFPQIHVVYRSLALPTVSQEQQVAEKLLVEGAHVDAIAALTEASTRGAFYALTEFNRTRTTPLIGFDQNLLAPIRISEIDSVIILNTYQMGRAAMKLMAEELNGGAAEQYVIVQPQLVTRENIDSDAVKEILDLNWFSK
jgi:ribose transport system substrate-binding protein